MRYHASVFDQYVKTSQFGRDSLYECFDRSEAAELELPNFDTARIVRSLADLFGCFSALRQRANGEYESRRLHLGQMNGGLETSKVSLQH